MTDEDLPPETNPSWISVEDAARLYPYIIWPEPAKGQTHWALHNGAFFPNRGTVETDPAPQETDPLLIAAITRTFGPLTLDLAATDLDHKTPAWLSPERDTFTVNWAEEIGDGIGWLNPPLDPEMKWFEKCAFEGKREARFLVITNAPIDSYQFWEYLLPNAIIYVLYPRMAYQGEPMPMMVAAFNVQHKGRKELDLTQLHLWNWVTGLIR